MERPHSPAARFGQNRRSACIFASHYPAYSSLLNIIHDHNFDKAFTLVYSFMLVEVTGNHLGAIVHAINYGNCERINEYHSKLYDRPGPNDPIIESVTITAAIGGSERR